MLWTFLVFTQTVVPVTLLTRGSLTSRLQDSHLLDLFIKDVIQIIVEVPDFCFPPGVVRVASIVNVTTVQDGRREARGCHVNAGILELLWACCAGKLSKELSTKTDDVQYNPLEIICLTCYTHSAKQIYRVKPKFHQITMSNSLFMSLSVFEQGWGKTEAEWTRKQKLGRIIGSRWSMWGYILIYHRLKREASILCVVSRRDLVSVSTVSTSRAQNSNQYLSAGEICQQKSYWLNATKKKNLCFYDQCKLNGPMWFVVWINRLLEKTVCWKSYGIFISLIGYIDT